MRASGWRFFLRRHAFASTLVVLSLLNLWYFGFFDFCRQTSFDKFQWGDPDVDVRRQVILQMTGKEPEAPKINVHPLFDSIYEPSCVDQKLSIKNSVLIIVKTAPHRLQHREAIRETWGRVKEMSGFKIRTVFCMGQIESYSDELSKEHDIYDDLLVNNFVDQYYNNTFKMVGALHYSKNYCQIEVPFTLLIDDDYYLSPPNLINELKKHIPSERLYYGWKFDSSPFRSGFSKHAISLEDYPYSRYPAYISAGAILLTSQSTSEFYYAIEYVKFFKFDDVYLGIIAYILGINPTHQPKFGFWASDGKYDDFKSTILAHGFEPYLLKQRWTEQYS
uniref:Hexosyltransferase n=1 Tax=Rhabditophanes sp. KR3021 TaxID=114890 RepID=A0AC35TFY9_9BILA